MKVFILSFESLMGARGHRHPLIAEMLRRRGCSVEYLTVDYNHAGKCRFSPERIRQFREQTPYDVRIFKMTAYRSNTSILRFFGHLKVGFLMLLYLLPRCGRGDIIVVNSQPPEFVLAAATMKRLRGARLVVDVRDAWPDGLPLGRGILHRLFGRYCDFVYRISVRLADYCIYTAPGFVEWVRRYCGAAAADFVPLGFDAVRWAGHRPLSGDDVAGIVRFVFVGDVNENMHIEPLVEAIAGDGRYSLTFIGGGDRLEAIKDLCRQRAADNIDFAGYLPGSEVSDRMGGFHIAVVPGRVKYVMPNKLFDAIGCFRPALVLGRNDAARFVLANDIGWSAPFDAAAIRRFLSVLDRADIVNKSNSISRVRDDFAEERLYGQLVDKTMQLCSSR